MNKYTKIIFFSSLILICGYKSVSAASIFVTQNQKSGLIIVDVMLDSKDQSVNAVSGTLSFDSSVLGNPSIRTQDSVINNWITGPALDELHETNNQTISWSGIIPGGFVGVLSPFYEGVKPGRLFQVVFTPLIKTQTTISVKNLDVRANDGEATSIPVPNVSITFGVNYISANVDSIVPLDSKNLHASIGQDKSIFNNRYFLAFYNSIDNGSIDHYEILETTSSSSTISSDAAWQKATSPTLLLDQERKSYIHLRAVGKDGSVAYLIINPDPTISKSKNIFSYVIIIIIILMLFILFKNKNKKIQ